MTKLIKQEKGRHDAVYINRLTQYTSENPLDLNDLRGLLITCEDMYIMGVHWDYANANKVINHPLGSRPGQVLLLNYDGYPIQLAIDYLGERYYIRSYYVGSGWTSWKTLAFISDIPD